MKLARYGAPGAEIPAILDGRGNPRSLAAIIPDIAGKVLTRKGLDRLRAVDPTNLPLLDPSLRLDAPVGQIGKMLCVGLNYHEHARESGMPVPDQPILVISTGTPPGVGLGQTPPVYLKDGDIIALGIDGLGEQRRQVIA